MSLTLYYHPLASFCWKPLVALYENDTPFKPHLVDLGDAAQAAALKAMWPIRKFPVLHDARTDRMIPESTTIIEYLDQHYRGETRFLADDPDLARRIRLCDRLYDFYLHLPMQAVVGDRLRPADKRDPLGVEQAKAQIRTTLDMIDHDMAAKRWAMGDAFSLGDCAAAPSLYYANKVMPFASTHRSAGAYLERLLQRPSFARVVKEAEPYAHMFPQ